MKKKGLIVMAILWLALGVFVTMVNTAAEQRAAEDSHAAAPQTEEKAGAH